MLAIIEKVKDLFKCKAERKNQCQPQQEEKPEDSSREQTHNSEEGGSN
ncbi:MAG: hypothetical protein ABIG61_01440 [Planctomycetota bacterium]